jgi:hypothetical protein
MSGTACRHKSPWLDHLRSKLIAHTGIVTTLKSGSPWQYLKKFEHPSTSVRHRTGNLDVPASAVLRGPALSIRRAHFPHPLISLLSVCTMLRGSDTEAAIDID